MTVTAQDLGFSPRKTELQRVLELPRSVLTVDNCPSDIVDYWTSITRRPGSDWRLRPAQALALHNLYWTQGLVGAINVGGGKSLISLLAHWAMPHLHPSQIMLLLPAANRVTIVKEAEKFVEHFAINTQIRIVSYEELSQPTKGPTLLFDYAPKLIICDEAHKLSAPDSARTVRALRYAESAPDCRWGVMSGTLFRKTLRSCAHLIELALRDGSPLPRSWTELENLSACCDVQQNGPPAAQPWQWQRAEALVRSFHPDAATLPRLMDMPVRQRQEVCRIALYERTRTAPGVVQTGMDDLGVALYLQPLTPRCPEDILQMMAEVEETWMLPNGQELETPLDMHRVKMQMSQGFYYRWVWPNDVPDVPWLRARNNLARATRELILRHRNNGIDTPALVRRGYEDLTNRPFQTEKAYLEADRLLETDLWQAFAAADWAWQAQSYKPEPETEPVWFSDWFLEHVIARAEAYGDKENATVWYAHRAVADRLEELKAPMKVFRAGEAPPPKEIILPAALSIRSHGTGHNLQGWGRGIVLSPPSSADAWEQLLGRLLRHGQQRDEVTFEIYAHTDVFANAIITAKRNAEFAEQTSGQPQKILYGDWIDADSS